MQKRDMTNILTLLFGFYLKDITEKCSRIEQENQDLVIKNNILRQENKDLKARNDTLVDRLKRTRMYINRVCPYVMRILRSFQANKPKERESLGSSAKGKGLIYVLLVPSANNRTLYYMVKVGRTKDIEGRIKGYPIGTEIMYTHKVSNMLESENKLITYMKNLANEHSWFKYRREYWNARFTTIDQWSEHVNTIIAYMKTIK